MITVPTPPRTRTVIALVATLAVLGPLAWMWQESLLPGSYSVQDMGYPDEGRRGPAPAMAHLHGGDAEPGLSLIHI